MTATCTLFAQGQCHFTMYLFSLINIPSFLECTKVEHYFVFRGHGRGRLNALTLRIFNKSHGHLSRFGPHPRPSLTPMQSSQREKDGKNTSAGLLAHSSLTCKRDKAITPTAAYSRHTAKWSKILRHIFTRPAN